MRECTKRCANKVLCNGTAVSMPCNGSDRRIKHVHAIGVYACGDGEGKKTTVLIYYKKSFNAFHRQFILDSTRERTLRGIACPHLNPFEPSLPPCFISDLLLLLLAAALELVEGDGATLPSIPFFRAAVSKPCRESMQLHRDAHCTHQQRALQPCIGSADGGGKAGDAMMEP